MLLHEVVDVERHGTVQPALAGRVYVVTGSTRGIGKAAGLAILSSGGRVLATGRHEETCAALREETAGYGDRISIVQQDMLDDGAGEHLVAEALRVFGSLDAVINNAASFDYKDPEDVGPDDWRAFFNAKLLGYRSLIEASVDSLSATRGAITNIAGVAGTRPSPEAVHVGATNAAVIHMTMSYAALLAPKGVRVNAISPGATDTARYATRVAARADSDGTVRDDARAALSREIPIGHPADPEEVGRMAVFLASAACASVTGAHVLIDGGSSLYSRRFYT